MAIPLRAFRIFAQQRPSTLKYMSELLCPTEGDSTARMQSLSNTSSMPLITSGEVNGPSTLLLETKYGLRLEIEYGQAFKISDVSNDARQYIDPSRQDDNRTGASGTLPTLESWPSGKRDTVVGAPLLEARNCYMILPEIYTSSFWSRSRPHDPMIDAEEIDCLYPILKPFFCDWGDLFQSSFERLMRSLDFDAEVFETVQEDVAFKTEGMLIACWLVLQSDVEDVKYVGDTDYLIDR